MVKIVLFILFSGLVGSCQIKNDKKHTASASPFLVYEDNPQPGSPSHIENLNGVSNYSDYYCGKIQFQTGNYFFTVNPEFTSKLPEPTSTLLLKEQGVKIDDDALKDFWQNNRDICIHGQLNMKDIGREVMDFYLQDFSLPPNK